MPNLERLTLHREGTLQYYFIPARCPKLVSIKLSGKFSDKNLYGIIACFPNLRSIEIDTYVIPVTRLAHIVVSQPLLTCLSLRNNPSLTDPHVKVRC